MKLTMFFCDIRGTFKCKPEEEYLLPIFANKLSKIREINGSDKMIFSFITSDGPDYMTESIDQLKTNLKDKNIVLGKQFFLDGYKLDDKVYKMGGNTIKGVKALKYIQELEETSEVTDVYFADDAEFYCATFKLSQVKIHISAENVTVLNPKGLEDLVNRLDEIVYKATVINPKKAKK